MMKKWLAVGIIFLFIGVAVAPSINTNIVQAASDDDLIEVTSEACGIKGYGNQTVKLTKQQYQNLEQYLVEFRARLNQTSTREEAVPIFKEAVVELNKYGLLPKGMSIKQAQMLVTGRYQNSTVTRVVGNGLLKKTFDTSLNQRCLLFGYSNRTQIWSAAMFAWMYATACLENVLNSLPILIHMFIVMLLLGVFSVLYFIDIISPVALWSNIYIHNGTGFLFSLGLNGLKKWTGVFDGDILGFTGFKLVLDLEVPLEYVYLGSAARIDLQTW